jgi:hypothetical protein
MFSPVEEAAIRRDFAAVVNMSARDLAAWLDTEESRTVGFVRRGERESVGRQSGARILAILATPEAELTAGDHAHMRKVVGFVRRHRAQRPWGDVTHTRWRWSLMNWGHDPLR